MPNNITIHWPFSLVVFISPQYELDQSHHDFQNVSNTGGLATAVTRWSEAFASVTGSPVMACAKWLGPLPLTRLIQLEKLDLLAYPLSTYQAGISNEDLYLRFPGYTDLLDSAFSALESIAPHIEASQGPVLVILEDYIMAPVARELKARFGPKVFLLFRLHVSDHGEGARLQMAQFGFKYADVIQAFTTTHAVQLIAAGADPVKIVRAPHFLGDGSYSTPDLGLISHFSFPDGSQLADFPYALYLGRATSDKGATVLAESLARTMETYPDLHAVIKLFFNSFEQGMVDSMRTRVHELGIADKVRFITDYLPRATVSALVAQAMCLLHPSLRETFGYVVLEAFAAGTPVIVGRGGPSCLNHHLVTGYTLDDPADPAEVARRLRQVYEDHRGLQLLSHAAKVRAQSYNERAVMLSFCDLLARRFAQQGEIS